MEATLDLEDDVFFADLSKQISLLIMDDDEDSLIAQCPSQAFTQAIHPATTQASFLIYDHQTYCKRDQSKGTGVFIPLSSHPTKKNKKQGRFRFTASGKKFQRHSDHQKSRGLPQMAHYSNISPSYYDSSYNLRRI